MPQIVAILGYRPLFVELGWDDINLLTKTDTLGKLKINSFVPLADGIKEMIDE